MKSSNSTGIPFSFSLLHPPQLHLPDLDFASDSSSAALDTLWLEDLFSKSNSSSPTPTPSASTSATESPPPQHPLPRDPLPHLDSANQPDPSQQPRDDFDSIKAHEVPSVSPSTSSFLFSHSSNPIPHSTSSLTEPEPEPASAVVVDSVLSLRPSSSPLPLPSSHAGRVNPSLPTPLHSKKLKSDRSASPAALFLLHGSSRLLAKLRKHFPNPVTACTSVPPGSPLLTKTTASATTVVFHPTASPVPSTAQGTTRSRSSADKRKSAPPALSLPPLPRHPPHSVSDSSIPPTPLAPRPKSVTAMESPNGLPRLDLSSLPYHGGHNSSDSDSSASPSSPSNGTPTSKRRGSKVQFSRYIKVSYTFAAEEYDRNPVEPPAMTAKDYYEYQVMAFEMHQAIRFETTMRQLGLWDNSTPGISQVPVVPTIPVVASTLERRKEVKATFSKGTKVVVAKPRTTSLQAQVLDLDDGLEDGLPVVTMGQAHGQDENVEYVHRLEAHTLALVDHAADAELDEQLADYERHYAALAGANGYATAAAIRT